MQIIRAQYNVEKQTLDTTYLTFDVLELTGSLELPHPAWFKSHTWKLFIPQEGQQTSSNNGSRGLVYTKYVTKQRNFWNYVENIMHDIVTEILTTRNYSPFKLEISRKCSTAHSG